MKKWTKAFQCFEIIELGYSTGNFYILKFLQNKNFIYDMKFVRLYYIIEFLLYQNIFYHTEIYDLIDLSKDNFYKSIISEINYIKKFITRIQLVISIKKILYNFHMKTYIYVTIELHIENYLKALIRLKTTLL